jgi:AraC-like DNA-binding protein
MTKPPTRSGAKHPSHAREAFERHQFPVWMHRYRGHEHRPARPGTFAHSYAVIVLVTRGQGRVRHAGDLVLRAGDVHLIPPGDAHGSAQLEGLEGWALAFHPEAVQHDDASWGRSTGPRLGPLLRVRSGCHPVLRPSEAQRERLEGWMRLLEHELDGDARSRDEAVSALLRLVLIELERVSGPEAAPDAAGQGLARQALTHIEANALGSLSLARVARAVGRSTAHVASVVRGETGRTVGQWILEYRMAEARRRLRGTDERVAIIAERVGYADVTHFIRLFRRVHGLTPAAWRRQAAHPARSSPR